MSDNAHLSDMPGAGRPGNIVLVLAVIAAIATPGAPVDKLERR
jgi:hypothetical protein